MKIVVNLINKSSVAALADIWGPLGAIPHETRLNSLDKVKLGKSANLDENLRNRKLIIIDIKF